MQIELYMHQLKVNFNIYANYRKYGPKLGIHKNIKKIVLLYYSLLNCRL